MVASGDGPAEAVAAAAIPGVLGALPGTMGMSSGSFLVLKEAVVMAVRLTLVHFDSPLVKLLSELIDVALCALLAFTAASGVPSMFRSRSFFIVREFFIALTICTGGKNI